MAAIGLNSAFTAGFALGFSLILAIGAQNAFVLRQGLKRQYVLAICLTCAISDATLIIAGVVGFEWLVTVLPGVVGVVKWLGALFLFGYGALSLRSAYIGGEKLQAGSGAQTLSAALLTCLALTWLNPHVYLDTMLLTGSISAQYEAKTAFAFDAALSSFVFFFALGYGARMLAPVFAQPVAWRILDVLICMVMWSIAFSLLTH